MLYVIWMSFAGLVAAVWLVRLLTLRRAEANRIVLHPESYDTPPSPAPRVSILVAAKDEEDNIESCVRSLLDQDYPDFEVIAVDDRSTDRTLEILRRLELQADGRLSVLEIDELPEGWFGKHHAMHHGIERSTGDWILLTDADCRQISNRTVSIAMRDALANETDFLSVTPILETEAVWERIVQPACGIALIIWFLPERVNNPNTTTAYANGQFMLINRKCYDAIGGHHRVRSLANEDIHLARNTKAAGFKLRVVENRDLYVSRMYRTIGEAWRGWSRIFYGCLESRRRLVLAACLVAIFSVAPMLSLIASAFLLAFSIESSGEVMWVLASWIVAVFLQQLVMWRIYPFFHARPRWSLTYALGALMVVGVILRAIGQAIGAMPTTWRGTTYRSARLAEES